MTKIYTYRGVTYTKDNQKTEDKAIRKEKLYRGTSYMVLPKVNHVAWDHVYRGAHYMA